MTQGLQFSLIFSGLDTSSAGDKAAASGQFSEGTLAKQDNAFNQLLQTERQQNTKAGQQIAASARELQASAKPVINSAHQNGDASARESALGAKVAPVPELAAAPVSLAAETVAEDNDLAGRWLGLIRQATDTSAELRYKMQMTNQVFSVKLGKEAEKVGPVADSLHLIENAETAANTAKNETQLSYQAVLPEQLLPVQLGKKVEEVGPAPDPSILATAAADAEPTVAQQDAARHAKQGSEVLTVVEGKAAETVGPVPTPVLTDETAQATDKTLVNINPAIAASAEAKPQKPLEPALETLRVSDKAPDKVTPVPEPDAIIMARPPMPESDGDAQAVSAELRQQKGVTNEATPTRAVDTPLSADNQAPLVAERALEGSASDEIPNVQLAPIEARKVSSADTALLNGIKSHELDSRDGTLASLTADAGKVQSVIKAPQQVADATQAQLFTAATEQVALANRKNDEQLALADVEHVAAAVPVEQSAAASSANNTSDIPLTAATKTDILRAAELNQQSLTRTQDSETPAPVIVTAASTDTSKSSMANVASDSASVSNKTVNIDSLAKQASNGEQQEQQGQPRQESRQLQFAQVEVSLAQSANTVSPTSQAGTEATTAFARAESFATVLAEQSRVSTDKPAATLAPSLQQLQLQQDAAGQLRERVQMMVRQNIQVAEIRLDPAELGQMQIRVNLQQEQASVQFIVQQTQAKELLEQQMPRLREMLQQQGIQLGEGQVQQQSRQDRQQADSDAGRGQSATEGFAEEGHNGMTERTIEVRHSERLVDYYA